MHSVSVVVTRTLKPNNPFPSEKMTLMAGIILGEAKGGKTAALDNPIGTRLRAFCTTPAKNHIEIRQQASKTAGLVFWAKPDIYCVAYLPARLMSFRFPVKYSTIAG